MAFAEKETILELLRPTMVIVALTAIETAPQALLGYNEHHVKIAVGVFCIVMMAGLDFALRKGTNIWKGIRHVVYPISRFEGVWFQRVGNKRPYSMAAIEYDTDGRWIYHGVGFDENFEPAAEWMTFSMKLPSNKRNWYFAGDAETLTPNRILKNFERQSKGYVVPIIDLPDEAKWGTAKEVTGKVIDLKVDRKDEVFGIRLFRADKVFPNGLPEHEEIKKMSREEIKKLFEQTSVPIGAGAPMATIADAETQ